MDDGRGGQKPPLARTWRAHRGAGGPSPESAGADSRVPVLLRFEDTELASAQTVRIPGDERVKQF
jgi:hypothetical protein